MKIVHLFFVLTLIVFIIFIIYRGSLTDALLLASILANSAVVYVSVLKLNKQENFNVKIDDPYENYSDKYNDWISHKNSYEDTTVQPVSPDNIAVTSVDLANTVMSRSRARDKNCIDGLVSKSSNYYKYHYGNDFVESENKPWWDRTAI